LHHQSVRSRADVESVAELAEAGLSKSAIARVTGVPRSTVRDWLSGGYRTAPMRRRCS